MKADCRVHFACKHDVKMQQSVRAHVKARGSKAEAWCKGPTARKHDASRKHQSKDRQHADSGGDDGVTPDCSTASEQGIGRHVGQEQDQPVCPEPAAALSWLLLSQVTIHRLMHC